MMKKLRATLVYGLTLSVLLSVTSHAVDNPARKEPSTSPSSTNPTLRLYALREQYQSGEAVDLILTIQNCSNQMVKILDETVSLDFPLTVQDQKGNGVDATRYGKQLAELKASGVHSGRPTAIPANDERVYSIRVNRLFDLTTIGRYTIRAQRRIGFKGDGPMLQSNEVTIAIVEAG